ncbi:MAG: N-acetylmuramoyl-L-alanine amidase [Crocinitomicaceae bacterium]
MRGKVKFLSFIGVLALALSFTSNPTHEKKIILIDAGHGGKDSGVNLDGFSEKIITEEIAKKIQLLNKDGNFQIILLRDGDNFIDRNNRVIKANELKPDLLISIHVNISNDVTEKGPEIYVSNKNEFYKESSELAEKLMNSLDSANKVKEGNFNIIRDVKCPGLLIEVGYLSNVDDKANITSDAGQTEIATKILGLLNEK